MTTERKAQIEFIVKHISSEQDVSNEDVGLVRELVFALCCSKETSKMAKIQMYAVVEINKRESMEGAL